MEEEQTGLKSQIESAVGNIVGGGENDLSADESSPQQDNKYNVLSIVSALFNGLGVGLLLGLLLGLAVSPVVSAMIGTLSSLLVVLIGLNERYLNPIKSIRIGAFGFFCVIGILAGIYLRNNNSFSPSIEDINQQYLKIGFSESDARGLIAYQKFRLIPEDFKFSIPAGADSLMNQEFQQGKTVLFSAEINAGQCYLLESSNINMSFSDIKKNYEVAGGTWKELADDLDASLPESIRAKTLLLLRDIFCESGESGTLKINCGKFQNNLENETVENIKQTLAGADKLWKQIVPEIDENIEPQYQEKLYHSLIKILCHD